mgnify:CR=1 FL=1
MKLKYLLLPILFVFACATKHTYDNVDLEAQKPNDWENPEVFRINKETFLPAA